MLRLTVLYLFVAGLMVTSVRRWYLALCGLLFLTVLMQNPNMPREIAGIQGLNPWNATLLVILVAWVMTRGADPRRAPTSQRTLLMFSLYVALLIVMGLVAAGDAHSFKGEGNEAKSTTDVIVDCIINPLKYLAVGVLFFDGATTRKRVQQAIFAAVGSGMCYALMMYKTLKMGVFTMDYSAARRATDKLVGLYANDMAEVLAFTLWAGVVAVLLLERKSLRAGWLFALAVVLPTFLALKSRAGFLACCMTGLVLGALRWRRILIAFPVMILGVAVFAPDVVHRVMTGVEVDAAGDNDWDAISAGRTTYLWPPALEQIAESPIVGHGRFAILRTELFDRIIAAGGRVPTHPHNSYLEILLDGGVIGLAICLSCMWGLTRSSWMLLRDRDDRLMTVLGAVAMIGILCELSAGVAGSSFYPSQSAVPYMCVWGVTMRVVTERVAKFATSRRTAAAIPATHAPLSGAIR